MDSKKILQKCLNIEKNVYLIYNQINFTEFKGALTEQYVHQQMEKRDAYYRNTSDVASDVLAEQEKINRSDAIAFIYPVFWTEAPAKLVGWFDRVWTYGYAYGDKTMKLLCLPSIISVSSVLCAV